MEKLVVIASFSSRPRLGLPPAEFSARQQASQ